MSTTHGCDRCENPATVHVKELAEDGKVRLSHLCQACAEGGLPAAVPTGATRTFALQPTTCSFCGKSSREVGAMVEGPNKIYICARCSEVAQGVFRAERDGLR